MKRIAIAAGLLLLCAALASGDGRRGEPERSTRSAAPVSEGSGAVRIDGGKQPSACDPATTCSGHGTCNPDDTCTCAPGFAPPNCSNCLGGYYGIYCTPCPGGASNPCNGHGFCSDGIAGNGSCSCIVPYSGPSCAGCMSGFWMSGGSCIPNPAISSVTWATAPTSGGSAITINGSNFGSGGGTVTVGGATATGSSWSTSQVIVNSPAGVGTGRAIVVTPTGGPATGGYNYSYDPPSVSGASPKKGLAGASIVVSGGNLGATSATGSITIGGATAISSGWGHSSATVTVPAGSGLEQPVRATVSGQVSGNWIGFSYTDTPILLDAARSGSDVVCGWTPNGSAALLWDIEEAPAPDGPWTTRTSAIRPPWTGSGDAAPGTDRFYRVALD